MVDPDGGLIEIFVEFLIISALLGILLAARWSQINHETRFLGHRDHRSNAFLLSLAKSSDSSWQHASVGSHVLREDQNVGVLDVQPESAFGAKAFAISLALGQLFHNVRLVRGRNKLAFDCEDLRGLVVIDFN